MLLKENYTPSPRWPWVPGWVRAGGSPGPPPSLCLGHWHVLRTDFSPSHLSGTLSETIDSLVAQTVKHLSTMWETRVQALGWEDPWRRKWQSTPVLLPGKSHGQRSLVGYSLWGCKESDMTEQLSILSIRAPKAQSSGMSFQRVCFCRDHDKVGCAGRVSSRDCAGPWDQ